MPPSKTRPARSTRRRPPARPREPRSIRWLLVAATMCALPALALLVLFLAPELQARHAWLAEAASFTPYGWILWAGAVVLALLGARGRIRLAVAPLALGMAWHTAVLVPYLPEPVRATAGPRASVTILALNLRFGLADTAALERQVTAAKPDVLVLTEATTRDQKLLQSARLARQYPYVAGTAGRDFDHEHGYGDPRGTLVASRYPLGEAVPADGTAFTNIALRLDLPGHPFTLIAAHPSNPEHGVDRWLHDGESLTRLALRYSDGPLVVAGDLNATGEHLTLRTLTARAGLTDAVAGQGWQPTFPANAWYPPLIQIDHVLTSRQFSPTSYRTVRVDGTDHLGLLVGLTVS